MTKYILAGIVVVLAIFGSIHFFGGNSVTYVADIDDVARELEDELAELAAAIEIGALTDEEAEVARAKIVAKLDAINKSVDGAEKTGLTEGQRVQLLDALDRLKGILISYSATLVTVETKSKKRGGSGGGKSLTVAIEDTFDALEDHVEDVIEEYESSYEAIEENASESDEEVVEDTDTAEEVEEDSSPDEPAEDESTSEDDTATTTEEATPEEGSFEFQEDSQSI